MNIQVTSLKIIEKLKQKIIKITQINMTEAPSDAKPFYNFQN